MPASTPPTVSFSVTVLLLPTFLVSNRPVAETVITSPVTMPPLCSTALVTPATLNEATAVPSYTLSLAVMPEIVNALGVIVAWVVWLAIEKLTAPGPPSDNPRTVTVLAVPAFLLAKLAVAPLLTKLTALGPTTPDRLPKLVTAAAALPLYNLSAATRPVKVKGFLLTMMF